MHIELDSHDLILAEGAPSETFLDDDSRAAFHNAAEFTRLYPTPANPIPYCAPRIEAGPLLATLRQSLTPKPTHTQAA